MTASEDGEEDRVPPRKPYWEELAAQKRAREAAQANGDTAVASCSNSPTASAPPDSPTSLTLDDSVDDMSTRELVTSRESSA